jgi:hypothetical protein
MNKNQKKTLKAGGILLLIALAFPPTNKLVTYSENRISGGYQLIFDMHHHHKVEYVQWVIPIIVIAAVTHFIFNAFKGKNEELH